MSIGVERKKESGTEERKKARKKTRKKDVRGKIAENHKMLCAGKLRLRPKTLRRI